MSWVSPARGDAPPSANRKYESLAREVTDWIQANYYEPRSGLYAHSPTDRHAEFMWGDGIWFSALVGATRHDPKYLPAMNGFFHAMDHYWDYKLPVPGYEPSPTNGSGNDKYFDDNEWMAITFTEAFEVTNDRAYLDRADQVETFFLTGWDEQMGGGIWWHETHKGGGKNTCSNGPAATACLKLARHQPPARARVSIEMARKIIDWTVKNLQGNDGLFYDNIRVPSGKVNHGKLTYNTALMIRAYMSLYRLTGDQTALAKAKQMALASDWFTDSRTHAYKDSVKWSHLLVEADLDVWRTTNDPHLLQRAIDNANYEYDLWKEKPPEELIDNGSIARTLWLLADIQTEKGRAFWRRVDHLK